MNRLPCCPKCKCEPILSGYLEKGKQIWAIHCTNIVCDKEGSRGNTKQKALDEWRRSIYEFHTHK